MNARPRVTQVVLYKHGIAHVERQGPADGEFELSFRPTDMNDVLKSLAVGVAGDAAVTTIAYPAPDSAPSSGYPQAYPPQSYVPQPYALPPTTFTSVDDDLSTLLRESIGLGIEVTTDRATVRGDLRGIESRIVPAPGGGAGERRNILVAQHDGEVRIVDLADVRGIRLVDAAARATIDARFGRSQHRPADECSVHVTLTGAADDVRVSYIVPSPVWRVSYRVICAGDSVHLVAMGIVRNPLDEELNDVALTLTTGRPVSFDIDLYQAKRGVRQVIEENSHQPPPPQSFDAGYGYDADSYGAGPYGAEITGQQAVPGTFYGAPPGAMPAPAAARAVGAMAHSMGTPLADSGDAGEYFEYRVVEPVSLGPGTAAMVPLLSAELGQARRERIWRDGSAPEPNIVVAFTNTTGAILEEGPAVIYDDGSYAGEAMMPYTTRGSEVLLAFAADAAVTCRRTSSESSVVTRVGLGEAGLIEEVRRDTTHTLRVTNAGDEEVDVVIELPRDPDTSIRREAGLLAPFEKTSTHRRFRLTAPAHGKTKAQVGESALRSRTVFYPNLQQSDLRTWLDGRLLDDAVIAELSGVLAHRENARKLETQAAELERKRKSVLEDQSSWTAQLQFLQTTGPEGQVRADAVHQLMETQRRATALAEHLRQLREQAAAEHLAAEAALREVIARHDAG